MCIKIILNMRYVEDWHEKVPKITHIWPSWSNVLPELFWWCCELKQQLPLPLVDYQRHRFPSDQLVLVVHHAVLCSADDAQPTTKIGRKFSFCSCIESRKDFDRTKFKDHTEQECTYCSFKSSTRRMQIVNISLHDMVLEIKSKHFYIDISCIALLQPTYFKRRETIRTRYWLGNKQ